MSAPTASTTTVAPASYVRGTVSVPGDKSIAHRYAILAALARGRSTLEGYAPGEDCASTLRCLTQLGVRIERGSAADTVCLDGVGFDGLRASPTALDTGNSGTTMRLLSGVLATLPFETVITGDASLRRRPMRRVAAPLERMGATVGTTDGRPPLTIHGGALTAIDFVPEVASAQVKSAVLLAGLRAEGRTWVADPRRTRDHTERALEAFGVPVHRDGDRVGVDGGQALTATDLRVPGDLSSAAYWLVAAAALPGSDVTVDGVGLNPSRSALLDVLRRAGARVEVEPTPGAGGEPVGRIRIRPGQRQPLTIEPAEVPGLIDELPVLAALATHGSTLVVRGARELRAKESDRIAVLVAGLDALGVDVEEYDDGFRVDGRRPPAGGTVEAAHDHRMAMAFAITALGGTGPTTIHGHDVVAVSYPTFFEVLDRLSGS